MSANFERGPAQRSHWLGWFYRLVLRYGPFATHTRQEYFGRGGAPLAGPGDRFSMMRERIGMSQDYQPGFGWQSLILLGIVAATAAVALFPGEVVNRFVGLRTAAAPLRPEVVVVSEKESDWQAVRQTVLPRRYNVRTAESVEAALTILEHTCGPIGFVVIDGEMAGAGRVMSAAKRVCPDARLIVLSGPRGAADIARVLVDAGVS
jgi:hypothetical protein